MHTRILDVDHIFGITRLHHYDPASDESTIETIQHVDDLVSANTALSNDAPSSWKGHQHRIASIPLGIYYDLKRKGVIDDPKAFTKWLNDRDNRAFRVRPGRV